MAAGPAELRLRPYRPSDCPALLRLFYETVHTACAGEYSPAQLDAWADGRPDAGARNRSLLSHDAWVAEWAHIPAGFADQDDTGYLDRLYVHPRFQRRGIASALCDQLERRSTAAVLTVHASITARPFFERRGYTLIRPQWVERHGILLQNFVMQKTR